MRHETDDVTIPAIELFKKPRTYTAAICGDSSCAQGVSRTNLPLLNVT